MNKVVAVICIVVGAYWTWEGVFTYGFWVNRGPGGGFLPVIAGIFTVVLGLLSFRSKRETMKCSRRQLVPIVAVFASIGGTYVLGMLPTVGLMLAFWLRYAEKISYGKSALITLFSVIFLYGVFGIWLKVPFPQGILSTVSW